MVIKYDLVYSARGTIGVLWLTDELTPNDRPYWLTNCADEAAAMKEVKHIARTGGDTAVRAEVHSTDPEVIGWKMTPKPPMPFLAELVAAHRANPADVGYKARAGGLIKRYGSARAALEKFTLNAASKGSRFVHKYLTRAAAEENTLCAIS